MEVMIKTTNREAVNTSGKGLYFQKNRAVIRILEHIKQFGDEPVYCAIEFIEDSLIIHDSPNGAQYKLEENKSYSTAISFNSHAIKNTLVAFSDQYIKFLEDGRSLKFSVYCCAKIAKEKLDKELLAEANIDVSNVKKEKEFSILHKIVNCVELNDEEIRVSKALFLAEYKSQYRVLDGNGDIKGYSGYFSMVSSWTDEKFLDFLSQIEWAFDESDKYLDKLALEKIKECQQYYSITHHKGKEELILQACRGLLEKRQFSNSKMGRFINSSDIENVFLKVGSNIEYEKPIDPAWKAFEGLENEDARNLKDKYKAVSEVITTKTLRRLSRQATNSKVITGTEFGKEYVSLRYKVFEIGEEFIDNLVLNPEKKYSEEELDHIVEEIVSIAEKQISDWKKTYKVRINDRHSLKGIVLSLFDDCFLAFDDIA
jgi:hypothetical protein